MNEAHCIHGTPANTVCARCEQHSRDLEVKATRAGQPHDYIATIALGAARCEGRAKDPVDALEEARQSALGLAAVMTGPLGPIEIPVPAREPRQEKP